MADKEEVVFVFMRHGEGTHNVAAWIHGEAAYQDIAHADAELTLIGVNQCVDAGPTLTGHGPYDAVFCSPLRRCLASLLAALPEAETWPVALDDRLMEPQSTHICNRRRNRLAVRESVPDSWNTTAICSINPFTRWREDMGSASPGFYARIREFTESAIASGAQRVLVVSHHEWIRRWFEVFMDLKDVSPANAEVLIGCVKS
jgi:broad specificity phosphatase PhoE